MGLGTERRTERRRLDSRHCSPIGAFALLGHEVRGEQIDRSGAASLYWRTGVCPHAPSGVGEQPGRQAASRGQRSRRSWAQSGTKSRLARSPGHPSARCRRYAGARDLPAASRAHGRRPEPRPSPFDGDALPGSAAIAKCPLSRAFERTTGFEPATLTLARPLQPSMS